MRIGLLRHRVDIERPITSQDSAGDPVITWTPLVRDVPAQVAPVSAREFVANLNMASQVSTRIMIRFRDDVDATMRIKHYVGNGRYDLYNIAGVLPDSKSGREFLILPATKGVNDG